MVDTATTEFERQRRRLFGIAYRMLGSVREAEDVLQDAWIRWHDVDHDSVTNPAAYLVRLVTRLCIDELRSARVRRTEYFGTWLPEPLVETGATPETERMHELADDLSNAFLLMLERLNPIERAVFVLREAFELSYAEIAEVVEKSEANCRQIERRARQHLATGGGSGRRATAEEHERLLTQFLEATSTGDLEGLKALFTEDAIVYSDSGGKARAAVNPIYGADRAARLFLGILRREADAEWDSRVVDVNGRPGLITRVDGKLRGVMALHVEGGRIRRIFLTVNPDKLPR